MDKVIAFIEWISLGIAIVKVPASSDKSQLQIQLTSHRHLELEIAANVKHYDSLVTKGEELNRAKKKDEDKLKIIEDLKTKWKELVTSAKDKILVLDQASAYCSFTVKFNQIKYQLKKIEDQLEIEFDGYDLTQLNILKKQHEESVNTLKHIASLIDELTTMGEKMIDYKHLEAPSIREKINEPQKTLKKLKV